MFYNTLYIKYLFYQMYVLRIKSVYRLVIGVFVATKNEEREIFSLSVNSPFQSINVFIFNVNHEKVAKFSNSFNEKKW